MLLPAQHDARPLLAQTVPTFSPPALLHPHTQLGRLRKESALESQERPQPAALGGAPVSASLG